MKKKYIGFSIWLRIKENIDEATILNTLDELIARWSNERESGECFGDFAIRAGIVAEVIIASKDFHD